MPIRINCECYDESRIHHDGADRWCSECDGTGELTVSVEGETLRAGRFELGRGEDTSSVSELLCRLAVDSESADAIRAWVAPSPEMERVIELSEEPASAWMVSVGGAA